MWSVYIKKKILRLLCIIKEKALRTLEHYLKIKNLPPPTNHCLKQWNTNSTRLNKNPLATVFNNKIPSVPGQCACKLRRYLEPVDMLKWIRKRRRRIYLSLYQWESGVFLIFIFGGFFIFVVCLCCYLFKLVKELFKFDQTPKINFLSVAPCFSDWLIFSK